MELQLGTQSAAGLASLVYSCILSRTIVCEGLGFGRGLMDPHS